MKCIIWDNPDSVLGQIYDFRGEMAIFNNDAPHRDRIIPSFRTATSWIKKEDIVPFIDEGQVGMAKYDSTETC